MSSITGRGTGRERCEENASVIEGTGRRSATSAQPGNPREPGLREGVGDYRSGEREHLRFLPDFFLMTVKEHDFAKMIAEVEETSWRIRETIRVRELAATNQLGQMRRLLMLEEHKKTWKREFGFDRIETAAEMNENHSRTSTSPVPDPFFYSNMINSKRPHTPDEFTLEIKVDVERLRMEISLSQPAPQPQCDLSPRHAAVDTGLEESGTPRRSPAIGTGSDEPGISRVETSTEKKGVFPFETSVDGSLHSNFTSPEQECILLHKPDVGVEDEKETTDTLQEAAVRGEFARPTKKRQWQRTTAWTTEQSKQFDRGKSQ